MQLNGKIEKIKGKSWHLKVKIGKISRKFTVFGQKNVWIRVKMTQENAKFYGGIQLDMIEEFNRNEDGGQEQEETAFERKKFENLRIWGEKIVGIRVKITGENTEFSP